ncbi:DUF4358 domain-containing protein [Fusibacter bizertensis]
MNRYKLSKGLILVLLLIMMPYISGCSHKKVVLDIEKVASEIASKDYFGEDFFTVESNAILQMYGVEIKDVKVVGYKSSGGLADELTFFEATNEEDAKSVYDLASEHIADSKEGYQSYKPDEVYKLEHAILLREGNYVIVCVNGSYDDLKTLIKSYLK